MVLVELLGERIQLSSSSESQAGPLMRLWVCAGSKIRAGGMVDILSDGLNTSPVVEAGLGAQVMLYCLSWNAKPHNARGQSLARRKSDAESLLKVHDFSA